MIWDQQRYVQWLYVMEVPHVQFVRALALHHDIDVRLQQSMQLEVLVGVSLLDLFALHECREAMSSLIPLALEDIPPRFRAATLQQ